jgi:hypothetical protein
MVCNTLPHTLLPLLRWCVQVQLVTANGTVFYVSRLSPYGFTFGFTPAPVGGTCGGFLCDEVRDRSIIMQHWYNSHGLGIVVVCQVCWTRILCTPCLHHNSALRMWRCPLFTFETGADGSWQDAADSDAGAEQPCS